MFCLLEQADVFVDALAADHRDQLLFCSVYGRDTSVQQLMARLHQASREGGVESLTVDSRPGRVPPLAVRVGDPRRLDKVTGRLPRSGLLGNLVHAWIFDPALLAVDHAGRSAWVMEHQLAGASVLAPTGPAPTVPPAIQAQVWQLVLELSPVPLLPAWEDTVLDHLGRNGAFQSPSCIGPLDLLRIGLPESFPDWVSDGVRHGRLAT